MGTIILKETMMKKYLLLLFVLIIAGCSTPAKQSGTKQQTAAPKITQTPASTVRLYGPLKTSEPEKFPVKK